MTARLLLVSILVAFVAATAPLAAQERKPADVPKLTVEEFDKARQGKDVVVLDVRTPEEFAAGHVPGAVNGSVSAAGKASDAFERAVAKLDKSTTLLVYCRSGVRSAKAVDRLRAMGFKNLSDFAGGWVAWEKAGKPTEQGSAGDTENPKR